MRKQNLLFCGKAILMSFFIGCSASPSIHTEDNKSVVRQWIEALNHRDFASVDALFDPNLVAHEPARDVHGIEEGPKQVMAVLHSAFPDIHFILEDLLAEGDKVSARWTASGSHQGEFLGISPTNKRVRLKGIYIYRLTRGKIAEVWISRDELGLLRQLGAIPPR